MRVAVLRLLVLAAAGTVLLAGCGKSEGPEIEVVQPEMKPVEPAPDDYVVAPGQAAIVDTDLGQIVFELLDEKAPNTVKNFVWLAKEKKFYDGLTFHRVRLDTLVQGGDPMGTGMGGPGYAIRDEFNDVHHAPGIVGMAKSQQPDSAGSQFYIVLVEMGQLDGRYAVFGRVIKGLDVVREISHVAADRNYGRPLKPVVMKSVKIADKKSLDLE